MQKLNPVSPRLGAVYPPWTCKLCLTIDKGDNLFERLVSKDARSFLKCKSASRHFNNEDMLLGAFS